MTAFAPGFLGQPRATREGEYLGTYRFGGYSLRLIAPLDGEVFSRYDFELEDIRPVSDGATYSFQVGVNGALFTSAYRYHVTELSSGAAGYASGNSNAAGQVVIANLVGSGATEALFGDLSVFMPSPGHDGQRLPYFISDCAVFDNGGNVRRCSMAGLYGNLTTIDRLQFSCSGTGFTYGWAHLWGRRRINAERRIYL